MSREDFLRSLYSLLGDARQGRIYYQHAMERAETLDKWVQIGLVAFAAVAVVLALSILFSRGGKSLHLWSVGIAAVVLAISIVIISFSWARQHQEHMLRFQDWKQVENNLGEAEMICLLTPTADWASVEPALARTLRKAQNDRTAVNGESDSDKAARRALPDNRSDWQQDWNVRISETPKESFNRIVQEDLQVYADANVLYQNKMSSAWHFRDALILTALALLAGIVLAFEIVAALGRHRPWTHWMTTLLAILTLIAAVLVVAWPAASYATMHEAYSRLWETLRNEADDFAADWETVGSDEQRQNLLPKLQRLAAKRDTLDLCEPTPDQELLDKCFAEAAEREAALRVSTPLMLKSK